MKRNSQRIMFAASLLSFALVTACGGGGSGSSSNPAGEVLPSGGTGGEFADINGRWLMGGVIPESDCPERIGAGTGFEWVVTQSGTSLSVVIESLDPTEPSIVLSGTLNGNGSFTLNSPEGIASEALAGTISLTGAGFDRTLRLSATLTSDALTPECGAGTAEFEMFGFPISSPSSGDVDLSGTWDIVQSMASFSPVCAQSFAFDDSFAVTLTKNQIQDDPSGLLFSGTSSTGELVSGISIEFFGALGFTSDDPLDFFSSFFVTDGNRFAGFSQTSSLTVCGEDPIFLVFDGTRAPTPEPSTPPAASARFFNDSSSIQSAFLADSSGYPRYVGDLPPGATLTVQVGLDCQFAGTASTAEIESGLPTILHRIE
ncbi:MAG: hypothetical protein ACI8TQ_002302 [Planctomycetota bacterium]|jgi:hypothetical protein